MELPIPSNIELGPHKGFKSTYAYLFTELCRLSKDVADLIPNEDPNFKKVVVLDVVSSHMSNDLQTKTQINEVISSIKSHLDLLEQQGKKNKNAMSLKNMYDADYAKVTADLPEIEKKRELLNKKMSEFSEYKNTELRIIIKAVEEGKPDADIQAMIAKVQEREKAFQKEVDDLKRAEGKMLVKLQNLQNQTSLGAGIPPTGPRPTPTAEK